jgi:hypothetical protein
MSRLNRLIPLLCCLFILSLLPAAAHAQKAIDRLKASAQVFQEVMDTPDSGIPDLLLKHSQCIMIVPGLKHAGFVFAASTMAGARPCSSPLAAAALACRSAPRRPIWCCSS